jgi:biopolymer transport protein ExbD
MAFSSAGEGTVKSDINITPLVDVVLVLLIIFMVMTPSLLKEMALEVPEKAELQMAVPSAADQVVVGISREGTLTVNREPITQPALVSRMHELLDARTDKLVFFDIDDDANYGDAVLGLTTK